MCYCISAIYWNPDIFTQCYQNQMQVHDTRLPVLKLIQSLRSELKFSMLLKLITRYTIWYFSPKTLYYENSSATHEQRLMKYKCSHPSVLQRTLCTAGTPCPLCPRAPATEALAGARGPPVPFGEGVTYETLHPRTPHVPHHSAWLAKLLLLCSHYPFNFSVLHGVSFLLLRLIQVQSIITPSGIG